MHGVNTKIILKLSMFHDRVLN